MKRKQRGGMSAAAFWAGFSSTPAVRFPACSVCGAPSTWTGDGRAYCAWHPAITFDGPEMMPTEGDRLDVDGETFP